MLKFNLHFFPASEISAQCVVISGKRDSGEEDWVRRRRRRRGRRGGGGDRPDGDEGVFQAAAAKGVCCCCCRRRRSGGREIESVMREEEEVLMCARQGPNSIGKKILMKIMSKSYYKKFMKSVISVLCLLLKLEIHQDFRHNFFLNWIGPQLSEIYEVCIKIGYKPGFETRHNKY